MSIDRSLDDYLEQQGITPSAEVVPDHACQIFEAPVAEELEVARQLVAEFLGAGESRPCTEG